jgi:general secretion pathway protein D
MMERYSLACQVVRRRVVSVFGLLLVLAIGRVSVADTPNPVEASGYGNIPLAHISAPLAKQMLDPLKLATISVVPGSSMLLLTGELARVQKARAILEVIDTTEPYQIKELRSASSPKALPSNDEIAAAIGGIKIGTFSDPPRRSNKAKAIIDVCNGSIWAVAPAARLAEIATALEAGSQTLTQQKAATDRITDGAMLHDLQPGAMLGARFSPPLAERKLNPPVYPTGRSQPAVAGTAAAASSSLLGQAQMTALAQAAPGVQADGNAPASSTPGAIRVTPEANVEKPAEKAKATEPARSEAAALQPGQTVPARPATAATTAAVDKAAASSTPAGNGAEPPMTAADLADPDRVVNVTLPEKLPVISLLDLVGKYLNLDYIYDPEDVKGEVTLKLNGGLRGAVKVKDLYYLLESILRFKNLAMTRHNGNVVTIVKKENAMDIDPRFVGADDAAGMPGDAVVTRAFKLEHIDTTSAKNLLEGMRVSMDVKPLEETSTILVTAYAYRMDRIEKLLSIVDKPGEPRRFHYRQLKYTMAKVLADKVKALAEQLQSVSVTVGEPEPVLNVPKSPTETDAQYTQRLNNIRVQQQAQLAAQRAAAGQRLGSGRPDQGKASVYLDADERTNRILMIGAAKQLDMVNSLVDSLDVEQQDLRSFKLYPMEHVDAQDVAKKLQELGIISKAPESPAAQRITSPVTAGRSPQQPMTSDEARIRAMQEQARAAAGLPPLGTEPSQQGPVEEPQVVVVESTNALLVNATAEQHAQIVKIIKFVDSEMLSTEIPYKIYPLENSSPDHMATVLTGLIQETTQNKDKEGKIVETTTVKKIQDEITIVPDPNTYSLIVYGNKKNQEWISSLIKQLDKRRPQVLINVTLVEITESNAFTSDLNAINSIPDLTATSGLTGAISGSVTSDSIQSKLSQSGRKQFADLQSNGGTLTTFYGDKHVNLLLTTMEKKHYGRVLAKPSILANDNQPGLVSRDNTTYVQTQSSIPVNTPGTGTQASVPTFTTSTAFTPYISGITLNITPHISEGDLLRLDIDLKRSDFTSPGGAKPPDLRKDQLTTGVTLPDGKTVILGGLLDLTHAKNVSKVPLLGDIPFVGGLFRSIDNSGSDSKLYMFIKAEIIRPATLAKGMEDLQNISDRSREAFEGHEKEFQDYESWPGVKPEPINPAKVLDAQ